MLSQINSTPRTPRSIKRHYNQIRIWEQIDATLHRLGTATTKDLMDACGISHKCVTHHMNQLRAIGEVRYGEPRRAQNPGRYPIRTWELGFDPTYSPDEDATAQRVAEPFVARRDPLVAALFGEPGSYGEMKNNSDSPVSQVTQ